MTDFGFYLVITNPAVGYAKCAEAAVRAGVKIIQLRMKHASREEILREAQEMRRVTAGTDQVRASVTQPIDYIGVGPVYATPTKDIPDPTLGLKTMGEMIATAAHPAVAIGGIDAARLPEVLAAGARNFAVVRAVCQSPDPYSAIMKLLAVSLKVN